MGDFMRPYLCMMSMDKSLSFREKCSRGKSRAAGRLLRSRWILFLLVAVIVLSPRMALAHSGGVAQLTNVPAGPYRVYAWTLPDPWQSGEAHVSIVITLPANREQDGSVVANQPEQVVTDAEVTVQFVPLDPPGHTIEVVAVLGTDLAGIYYEADTVLPAPGEWQTTINVSGAEGTGSATFVETVVPPKGINWILVGGGAGALILIVGLIGWWSGRDDGDEDEEYNDEEDDAVEANGNVQE